MLNELCLFLMVLWVMMLLLVYFWKFLLINKLFVMIGIVIVFGSVFINILKSKSIVFCLCYLFVVCMMIKFI